MESEYFDTVHTKVSYYLLIIAVIGQLVLALPLLFFSGNMSEYEKNWRLLALYVGIGGFACLIFTDLFSGYGLKLRKQNFRPFTFKTFVRTILLFFSLIAIQFLSKLVPLSIRGWEIALAGIVAAPTEEMIFRGALLSFFILISSRTEKRPLFKLPVILRNKEWDDEKREFSLSILAGIIISGLIFAMYHQNYYGNIPVLLSLFFWGLTLAFAYIYWRDITAVILAHFLINLVWGLFYLSGNWWQVYF